MNPEPLLPRTSILTAGSLWLDRLQTAGLGDSDDLDEDDLLEREQQRHHAQRTIDAYRNAFTIFARWLERQGRHTISDLTLADLSEYVRALRRRDYDLSLRAVRRQEQGEAERLSPRTLHSYTRPLFGFLAMLEAAETLSFTVVAATEAINHLLPRLPSPIAPAPPDLRRLATYYDKPLGEDDRTERFKLIRLRNAAMLHILFSSGARISEALSLNAGDISRDRRILSRVVIMGKGRREGIIFLRPHAERAVRAYLEARGYPSAGLPLFESYDRRTAGARLSRSSAWRIVNEAATAIANRLEWEGRSDEAALLRTTSPHTFRHFVGYHLLNEGVELAEVSQILRHRSVEVTRNFYARYRDMQLQEVHDQFSPDPLS